MHPIDYIHRVINFVDPSRNFLFNMGAAEAEDRVRTGDPARVAEIQGQFAICARDGQNVRMARSIGRPMRYFLAKQKDGPCLIVAERMEQIQQQLRSDGLSDQFHPTYTRMVPAHFVVSLELIGCPDPNPSYDRYFAPVRNRWSTDLDAIGERYIGQLSHACDRWLDQIPRTEPIGVLFSGGIDSGAVLLTLYDRLLSRGESASRLKAFTLCVDRNASDVRQAMEFVHQCGIPMLLEVVDVPSERLDWRRAVHIIEDYKPLDVQSATMAMVLCEEIRNRYPAWRYLADGDGGDENLKDYPIEENSELTIRSVLNNTMLYQEGWGVHAIKHSLVHSGGQSRGHVRSSATAAYFGFQGFSPLALPQVIEVAEGIPFIELTGWDHAKLYSLKGEVVRRGVLAVTGIDMPVFEKRRFQHGAIDREKFRSIFPDTESPYRQAFLSNW